MLFFSICLGTFLVGFGFIKFNISQSTKEFNDFVDRTIPADDDIMPL